jgi:2-keto-4-pentenoate hydratase/2-oxohepta-3-ene-1,7-dioic acid hydratase in catechol pathway
MKLVTFEADGQTMVGVHLGEEVVRVAGVDSMTALLGLGERALALAREASAGAGQRYAAGGVRLLAPVPRPGKVICLGLNYADHARETGAELPTEPAVFSKASTSVIGPGETIRIPRATQQVDYEVEMAAVIGRGGKDIDAARAAEHVAGYTILNDVSARDYQLTKPAGQWYLGKSFDTFCPMGPWLVTPDEIGDPYALAIRCRLHEVTAQDSNTSNLIFRVPQIIEYVSRVFTLEPGDVISTGTPGGVGMARTPPVWLSPGDRVVCEVEAIGRLENPVAAAQ